jgi:hypothetical protein
MIGKKPVEQLAIGAGDPDLGLVDPGDDVVVHRSGPWIGVKV